MEYFVSRASLINFQNSCNAPVKCSSGVSDRQEMGGGFGHDRSGGREGRIRACVIQ